MMRFALTETRLSKEATLLFLQQLRDVLTSYLRDLEGYAVATKSDATLHQRLSLEHGIMVNKTRLAWAETAISQVRSAMTTVAAAVQ